MSETGSEEGFLEIYEMAKDPEKNEERLKSAFLGLKENDRQMEFLLWLRTKDSRVYSGLLLFFYDKQQDES